MRKKKLTNSETVGISCLVSIVGLALFLIPAYFTPFFLAAPVLIVTVPPAIIIGAFAGKNVTDTRRGAWLGALVGAIAGYGLFFFIAFRMSFD